MSIENAKLFYERVTQDEKFRLQLEQATTAKIRRQLINAAGFEFTNEDWEVAKVQILAASDLKNGELSEEELTAVSGRVDLSILELIDKEPLFLI